MIIFTTECNMCISFDIMMENPASYQDFEATSYDLHKVLIILLSSVWPMPRQTIKLRYWLILHS
jgi:hypothetical protein